jgi:hypothetical protein
MLEALSIRDASSQMRGRIVIASEAKQSRNGGKELDCFVARAPRNDGIRPVVALRAMPGTLRLRSLAWLRHA